MTTIHNSELEVKISCLGAEVQSITDAKTGHEYMWNGDKNWWHGHSPILFPICGGTWNGISRFGGQEYRIPKHGFVRRKPWVLTKQEEACARFEYHGTVGDFALFPYAFCLIVTYKLEGRKLTAELEVQNLSGADLYFQIGGHPAIALPDWKEEEEPDGYLKLEGRPEQVLRAGDQGCTEPARFDYPHDEEGLVPLCVKTFNHEALIFDNRQVEAAVVLDKKKHPIARISSEAPVWLFWSPQGQHTPFICCEPWYGLCDKQGFEGDVSERPYIQKAEAYSPWQGWYAIEILS